MNVLCGSTLSKLRVATVQAKVWGVGRKEPALTVWVIVGWKVLRPGCLSVTLRFLSALRLPDLVWQLHKP